MADRGTAAKKTRHEVETLLVYDAQEMDPGIVGDIAEAYTEALALFHDYNLFSAIGTLPLDPKLFTNPGISPDQTDDAVSHLILNAADISSRRSCSCVRLTSQVLSEVANARRRLIGSFCPCFCRRGGRAPPRV